MTTKTKSTKSNGATAHEKNAEARLPSGETVVFTGGREGLIASLSGEAGGAFYRTIVDGLKSAPKPETIEAKRDRLLREVHEDTVLRGAFLEALMRETAAATKPEREASVHVTELLSKHDFGTQRFADVAFRIESVVEQLGDLLIHGALADAMPRPAGLRTAAHTTLALAGEIQRSLHELLMVAGAWPALATALECDESAAHMKELAEKNPATYGPPDATKAVHP